ncbi:MAG: hypothetical protein OET90_08620 [Desulfuromonadales bacterium]|nr:hypothetical protein [Desulfuromonadales bacterium]
MSLTITLGVNDLEQSEIFYRDLLRLPIERHQPRSDAPPFLLLRSNAATIVFRSDAVLQSRHPSVFQNLDHHPKGVGVSLEFEITELDALERRVDSQGHALCYQLDDDESGWQEIWLYDPDGYLLILSENRGRSAPDIR